MESHGRSFVTLATAAKGGFSGNAAIPEFQVI